MVTQKKKKSDCNLLADVALPAGATSAGRWQLDADGRPYRIADTGEVQLVDGSIKSSTDTEPVELDPPDPALARWEVLADRDHEVDHDGDAEKVLGSVHPRPAWADPDEDITGRSHLSTGYKSRAVRVRASHAFGVDHGDRWQPACAFVHATLWGNSHESITVTLSQVVDRGTEKARWQNIAMSFQPHEAAELAEVLQAALELIGGEK